jgi:hypothetical protein
MIHFKLYILSELKARVNSEEKLGLAEWLKQ